MLAFIINFLEEIFYKTGFFFKKEKKKLELVIFLDFEFIDQ